MSILSATILPRQRQATRKVVRRQEAPLTARELRPRELWELGGDNRWRTITCHQGEVWVTQTGDLRDHLLTAGESALITLPGLVLIQALTAASVEVGPSLQNGPFRGRQPFFA